MAVFGDGLVDDGGYGGFVGCIGGDGGAFDVGVAFGDGFFERGEVFVVNVAYVDVLGACISQKDADENVCQ